jgi:hypothetical protein
MDGKPRINSPEEIVDLKARGYYWYKNNENTNLDFILNTKKTSDLSYYAGNSSDNLLKYLIKNNFNIFNVDITDSKNPGMVHKVLIPELQPLRLIESKDFFVSERLYNIKQNDFNTVPHPFT